MDYYLITVVDKTETDIEVILPKVKPPTKKLKCSTLMNYI